MTWAFGARGTLEECRAQLELGSPPDDPANAHQYDVMLAILKAELAHYGEGSTEMSVHASGHAPDKGSGDRSFSIWVSGKAAPHVKAAEPTLPVEPPPVDETPQRGRPRR